MKTSTDWHRRYYSRKTAPVMFFVEIAAGYCKPKVGTRFKRPLVTSMLGFPLDVRLPDDEEAVIHEVLNDHSGEFLEYHKLRTRKAGHLRHIDMHLVVPKNMSVETAHKLSHTITAEIENRLAYSHILVHIEPCQRECEGCIVKCNEL